MGEVDMYTRFLDREGIGIVGLADSDSEPGFSWGECDCCGSSLGGDRYICHGANAGIGRLEVNGVPVEFELCVDCYVALCS